jgi:hypothetical protein
MYFVPYLGVALGGLPHPCMKAVVAFLLGYEQLI